MKLSSHIQSFTKDCVLCSLCLLLYSLAMVLNMPRIIAYRYHMPYVYREYVCENNVSFEGLLRLHTHLFVVFVVHISMFFSLKASRRFPRNTGFETTPDDTIIAVCSQQAPRSNLPCVTAYTIDNPSNSLSISKHYSEVLPSAMEAFSVYYLLIRIYVLLTVSSLYSTNELNGRNNLIHSHIC